MEIGRYLATQSGEWYVKGRRLQEVFRRLTKLIAKTSRHLQQKSSWSDAHPEQLPQAEVCKLKIDPLPPNLSFLHPKTTLRTPRRLRAPAHMMQGSQVTYKSHLQSEISMKIQASNMLVRQVLL